MTQHTPDYYDHPIFTPEGVHLSTPAMRHFQDAMQRWLWTGAAGAYITGAARVGKSTAAKRLVNALRTRGGQAIPGYRVPIQTRSTRDARDVYRLLCRRIGLLYKRHETSTDLMDGVVYRLEEIAHTCNSPHILLIVDEMQRLQPRLFEVFADLADELLDRQIGLLSIFVANEREVDPLLECIESPAYDHIRGRFFTQHAVFRGLVSSVEVKHCLAQYDTLRYPDDGPTYVEYFVPQAFAEGWRLAEHSALIWSVFRQFQKEYAIGSWGMQYFTACIQLLLVDFLPRYGTDQLDDEMLHECVRLSGLVPGLVEAA